MMFYGLKSFRFVIIIKWLIKQKIYKLVILIKIMVKTIRDKKSDLTRLVDPKNFDLSLFEEVAGSHSRAARFLNRFDLRRVGLQEEPLTDQSLLQLYRETNGFLRFRQVGQDSVNFVEDYFLNRGLIDLPRHFSYLPEFEAYPVLEGGIYTPMGMAELVIKNRILIYPAGIFRTWDGPHLIFGTSVDDDTGLISRADVTSIRRIKKFSVLNEQQTDPHYDRNNYSFFKRSKPL